MWHLHQPCGGAKFSYVPEDKRNGKCFHVDGERHEAQERDGDDTRGGTVAAELFEQDICS